MSGYAICHIAAKSNRVKLVKNSHFVTADALSACISLEARLLAVPDRCIFICADDKARPAQQVDVESMDLE